MGLHYILWTGNIYAGAIGKDTMRLETLTHDGFDLTDFTYEEEVSPPEQIVINIFEQDIEKDLPPAFVVPTLIMRKDLVEDLKKLGANNITGYPVILRHASGKQWNEYYIIKIEDCLDAIDNSKSEISEYSKDNHIL